MQKKDTPLFFYNSDPDLFNENRIVFSCNWSTSRLSVFPDYLEVATSVVVPVELVKLFTVHRYSVYIFSCSGPSGIFGSDGKQNTT